MPDLTRFARPTLLLALTTGFFTVPQRLNAQDGYFFRPPAATFNLRVGAAAPAAHDDLFKFFTQQLTLSQGDFRTTAVAADLGIRAAPRFDIVIGVGFDRSNNRSEFRDWVDQDDQPIEQTTRLLRIPLTVSGKYYLTERGRSVSRLAWVPVQTLTPYLTAGAGVMFYGLKQEGDFVNFETLDVFSSRLASDGTGTLLHVGAGAEWWLSKSLGLTAEGRYAWSSAQLDSEFSDFDRIDLRGAQVTTGLAVRF